MQAAARVSAPGQPHAAPTAPLVDEENFRENDNAEDGEEHDDDEEAHVGPFTESPGPLGRPLPATDRLQHRAGRAWAETSCIQPIK